MMIHRTILSTACIALLSLYPALLMAQGSLTPPGPPAPIMKTLDQIEARVPISTLPYTISESGSYYLTGNLTGLAGENGITIAANDVTIDLNGFALVGVADSKNGIYSAESQSNLAISNGTLRSWGMSGIMASGANGVFKGTRAANNKVTGILVGPRSIIMECEATSNGQGGISMESGSICTDSIAQGNGFAGFILRSASARNCTAVGNGEIPEEPEYRGPGFFLFDLSNVSGCRAYENYSHGILVYSHSVVENNTCISNGRDDSVNAPAGIFVVSGGYGNRIKGNHVSGYNGIKTVTGGNLIIGNSGTNSPYSSIAPGNTVGPIIDSTTIGTNSNPHANYEF